MKEAKYNKRGTKQIVDTGWKLFDNQTNCISTGNVYASTQLSSFIRPYSKTECNGGVFQEGHLMQFDLKPFSKFYFPSEIAQVLMDKKRDDSVILYMFFVTNKYNHVEPFCWVITDRQHNLVKRIVTCERGSNMNKRARAAVEVTKYITNQTI